MDIITEILETDKAASERLEQAQTESGELIEKTQAEQAALKEDALREAEEYNAQKAAEVDARIKAETDKIAESESRQINALEDIYNAHHKEWEDEIFSAVTGL